MPHRVGEVCEACRKHIHPYTKSGGKLHLPPSCDLCLPVGQLLQVCGGCKLTLYCGKACQKRHRPAHKEPCGVNIWIKKWAQAYGPEAARKQASFARWCENNNQVFAHAAREAWGIASPSQISPEYDYVLFIVVKTDSEEIASDSSEEQTFRFTHSVVGAHKDTMKELFDEQDKPTGLYYRTIEPPPRAAGLKEYVSSSPGVVRIVLQNVDLLPPVNLYTLSITVPDERSGVKHHPDWIERLKEAVK